MNKNNIEASLIIVNYNGFEITKNCLDSIFANSGEVKFEVIVVDSASSDGSPEKLRELFGKRKNFFLIKRPKNDFLAAAYNDGFKKSRGQIVVFMNNDLIVSKNWLTELLKAFKNKGAGIAGVSLLSYKQKNQIDNLGCGLNFLVYGKRIGAGEIFKPGLPDFLEAFFVPGSVLSIKRQLFEKIEGFDENYGGNYEDVDLSWRTRLLGYKVLVAKKSIVYHLGSWTVKKYLSHADSSYLCRKNRLATILKNAGPAYLILMLPVYFLLQLLIFLKELVLDRNLSLTLTTPKAIYWNLINLSSLAEKRRKIQKARKVSDWQILKLMSFF